MRLQAVPVLLFVLVVGCGGPQTPDPELKPPTGEGEGTPDPKGELAKATSDGVQLAPTASIDTEIILTYSINSLDTVLTRGLAYVRPHLPPALSGMLQPAMLKAQLFKSIRMPQLEQAVDASRPWGLAIADPKANRGGGQFKSMLIAVPVSDTQVFTDALGQVADQHERTPWNDHHFSFRGDTLRVRFADGYALVAAQEKLLNGAAGVLLPLVKAPEAANKAARLRFDLASINRLYANELDKGMRKMKRKMKRKGPQMAGISKMVTRWIGYVQSIKEATLAAELDPTRIRLLGEVNAASSGEFPTYLSKLRPGKPWGARFLPADSGLIFVTRQSPSAMQESIEEGIELLRGLVKGLIPDSKLGELRDLARKSAKHLSGESAGAMWVNADGGFGFGTASRVRSSAGEAQMMTRELLKFVGRELNRLLTKGLPPKVRQDLKGFNINLRTRKLRVAGVKGDLLELSIRWPRLKDAAARKKVADFRKRLAKVFGRRISLALVAHKDVLLLTGGKDCRKRMAKMVAIAKGGAGTGMDKVIDSVVGNRRVVAVVHSPLATLAEQSMRLAEKLTKVPTQAKDMFQKMLPPPGKTMPVTAVVRASGSKMMLELDVSAEVVGLITRGVMGAMTPARRGP